jgi:hypothetical protein
VLPVVVDDELEDEGRVPHHIVQFHHLARDLSLQCSPSQKNRYFKPQSQNRLLFRGILAFSQLYIVDPLPAGTIPPAALHCCFLRTKSHSNVLRLVPYSTAA